MAGVPTLDDVDVSDRRVIVRADLNVPLKDGAVADTTRIAAAVATIRELVERGAAVLVLSHFARPEGRAVAEMSLAPVAEALEAALGKPVRFVETDWRDARAADAARDAGIGDVLLFENTRFHPGEEANDSAFAAELASLGDVFVNDAFSAAHRAHASNEGIARLLPSCAGRAMEAELGALERALESPERPVIAIVGGAKVSTKLDLLANLSARVDRLVIGGAMANTFLAAQGHGVGASRHEQDRLETARSVRAEARNRGCEIVLPVDVVAAGAFEADAAHRTCGVDEVAEHEMILDVGPRTVAEVAARLDHARTLLWNGPVGAFELVPFDAGTIAIARHAAALTRAGRLLSVAGGGDTVAALNRAGVVGDLSFVSTAGGAFLEWLEGRTLPGVAALRAAR